jgi:hypothetical protein
MAVQTATPSGVVKIRVEPGVAWIWFEVKGQMQGPDGIELVGKVACAFCDFDPMTVSAMAGCWDTSYCPRCSGQHCFKPAEDVPAAVPVGEVA